MLTDKKLVPTRPKFYLVPICTLLAMLVSLVATSMASANGTSGPRTWHAVVGVESRNHATQGLVYLPGTLWVNVGDTVVWTARSGDIHTVTFLPPGQTPPPFTGSPDQVNRVGGNVYDGTSYFNSGLLSDIPVPGFSTARSYSLTFGVPGDFVYHCLVHPSMLGIIHVRPVGALYPYSQKDYDKQIRAGTQTVLHDGQKLADFAENHSNNHNVILGIGDTQTSVVRFFPSHITIHVGDTITFTSQDAGNPHTVTFGPEPPPQDVNAPYGDPTNFNGQYPLSSGILFFGQSFKVTFKKAGTFPFRCLFHDYLGMTAIITVK
jgi:plastocyanin